MIWGMRRLIIIIRPVHDGPNQEGRLTEQAGGARRNKRPIRTLDVEYGITLELLLQHSDRKIDEVADIVGVCRSTLKRICRKHGIKRWPPKRAKRTNNSQIHQHSTPLAATLQDGHHIHNSIATWGQHLGEGKVW